MILLKGIALYALTLLFPGLQTSLPVILALMGAGTACEQSAAVKAAGSPKSGWMPWVWQCLQSFFALFGVRFFGVFLHGFIVCLAPYAFKDLLDVLVLLGSNYDALHNASHPDDKKEWCSTRIRNMCNHAQRHLANVENELKNTQTQLDTAKTAWDDVADNPDESQKLYAPVSKLEDQSSELLIQIELLNASLKELTTVYTELTRNNPGQSAKFKCNVAWNRNSRKWVYVSPVDCENLPSHLKLYKPELVKVVDTTADGYTVKGPSGDKWLVPYHAAELQHLKTSSSKHIIAKVQVAIRNYQEAVCPSGMTVFTNDDLPHTRQTMSCKALLSQKLSGSHKGRALSLVILLNFLSVASLVTICALMLHQCYYIMVKVDSTNVLDSQKLWAMLITNLVPFGHFGDTQRLRTFLPAVLGSNSLVQNHFTRVAYFALAEPATAEARLEAHDDCCRS